MGQCISQEAALALNGGHLNAKGQSIKGASSRRVFLPIKRGGQAKTRNETRKVPKLTIITTQEEGGGVEAIASNVEAPLTGKTEAETPLPNTQSPASTLPTPVAMRNDMSESSASREESQDDDEQDESELPPPHKGSGLSLVSLFQSLRHTEELDHVIPEEIDADAPSDEEEERIAKQQEMAKKEPPPLATKTKSKTAASPPRPQDLVKMQHSRMRNPNSIVNRPAPDDAATGSVRSHHLSEFRKLKVQVKLAARQERKKARIAKLEDRYEDVRGYNRLWQDFEEIRGRTEGAILPASKLKRSDSFDLHDTGSWFFDFQAMDEEGDASCYDFDDDDISQSSLSLHSTTSMESQRRYFREKRQGRRKRQHSDSNLFLMNQIITTKTRKTVDESIPTKPMYAPNHESASTPPSILRGIKKNEASDNDIASEPLTPHSRGPVAPQINVFSIATGQPEYHVYKSRPGEAPIEHDSNTPKATSRRKNTISSETDEVDMDNDYQVVRRRRVNSCSDATFLKDADERSIAESLGIQLPPTPEKREFDYSSFAIEVVTTDQPEVKVMRMSPSQNDKANRKEMVVGGNADRCLEETSSTRSTPLSDKKKRQAEDKDLYRDAEPPRPSVYSMTTEDFLRFGDGHALVNVSNSTDHEIRSLTDDKENDACEYDGDIAEDVTDQIDVLLAKYRTDNKDVVGPSADDDDTDGSQSQVLSAETGQ